jgi:hypothetical protein
MTSTIETTETTKKTGPTDEIFPVSEDGQLIREKRVAVWSSKHGRAKSFRIDGQLYVQFPVRPKPAKPAPGDGA